MHMGQGSQVEYMVNPARDGRLSFLQARRTALTSACELGSFSRRTALVARRRGLPVLVFTINAPKGTGDFVSRVRAVKRWMARMCFSSFFALLFTFSPTFSPSVAATFPTGTGMGQSSTWIARGHNRKIRLAG